MCISQCVPLPGWAPVSVGAGVHLHMCRRGRQALHTSLARSCGSSWQGCCLRSLALLPCWSAERSAPFKPAALLAALTRVGLRRPAVAMETKVGLFQSATGPWRGQLWATAPVVRLARGRGGVRGPHACSPHRLPGLCAASAHEAGPTARQRGQSNGPAFFTRKASFPGNSNPRRLRPPRTVLSCAPSVRGFRRCAVPGGPRRAVWPGFIEASALGPPHWELALSRGKRGRITDPASFRKPSSKPKPRRASPGRSVVRGMQTWPTTSRARDGACAVRTGVTTGAGGHGRGF